MLHFVSYNRKNSYGLFYASCTIIACLLFISTSALSEDKVKNDGGNIISKVSAHVSGNDLTLRIHGSVPPTYTVFELFKPPRIIVEAAGAVIASPEQLSLPGEFGVSVKTETMRKSMPRSSRLEFTLDKSYAFTTQEENNNIVILIHNFKNNAKDTETKTESTVASGNAQTSALTGKNGLPSIESQLPAVEPMTAATVIPAKSADSTLQDKFNFSGYKKERITVDFYKIDLHNVFRLLREVSGANIVVDESVKGSLTLALDDVPWDFALDIILNLKDLAKEERFNTIVIHPKDKPFDWPVNGADNLSFETVEDDVANAEALIIQRQEAVPPEVEEAKAFIAKARKEEKRDNIELAVQTYEKAFAKWPKNSQLASKIADIYLVILRQNSKAAYYAEKALKSDRKSSKAALTAAIAYANMHEKKRAQQFFDQSISSGKSTEESFLSYAAFSEQENNFEAALKLLKKHDEIFGKNVVSMVSVARILDKQGKHDGATQVYKSILLAGMQVPADLKKFILDRIK